MEMLNMIPCVESATVPAHLRCLMKTIESEDGLLNGKYSVPLQHFFDQCQFSFSTYHSDRPDLKFRHKCCILKCVIILDLHEILSTRNLNNNHSDIFYYSP